MFWHSTNFPHKLWYMRDSHVEAAWREFGYGRGSVSRQIHTFNSSLDHIMFRFDWVSFCRMCGSSHMMHSKLNLGCVSTNLNLLTQHSRSCQAGSFSSLISKLWWKILLCSSSCQMENNSGWKNTKNLTFSRVLAPFNLIKSRLGVLAYWKVFRLELSL